MARVPLGSSCGAGAPHKPCPNDPRYSALLDALQAQRDEYAKTLARIDKEFGAQPLDGEARERFAGAVEAITAIDEAIREKRATRKALDDIAKDPVRWAASTEGPEDGGAPRADDHPYRTERLSDGLRSIDRQHRDGVLSERAALRLDSVLRRDRSGSEARYLTAVSDPEYARAFSKIIALGPEHAQLTLTAREREAVAEASGAMAGRADGRAAAKRL